MASFPFRRSHAFLLVGLVFVFAARARAQTAANANASAPKSAVEPVPASDVVKLEKVEVSTNRAVSMNSIDRKVYNVGKDILATTGSTSDLLNNIPSISVNIDGAISLRGSENVTILIDGRSSPLMGANRAAVLEQMSADSIVRVEVITNPSAKYKPDGTSGIINIVTRKKHDPGFSGSVSANAGNDDRENATVAFAVNPGPYSVSGSYSVRQDDRLRRTTDQRTRTNLSTGAKTDEVQTTEEISRPLSRIVRIGLSAKPGAHDDVELAGSYNHRGFTRGELSHTITAPNASTPAGDHDRRRIDFEYEKDRELSARYQHAFDEDGHELTAEFKLSRNDEQEDNRYTDIFRLPATPASYDNTLIRQSNRGSEFIVEYVRPLADDGKFESGYTRETNRTDMDFRGEFLDAATGRWTRDTVKTNRFIYDETVHALYATYGRSYGKFGFLAGARTEKAFIDSHVVATGATIPNDYFRLYPSLHLAYGYAENRELQLNYSHRVRRPEGDDLNPFPEYRDPQHLRAGNPLLKPEDIHSIEFGHQYRKDETSLVTTAYYRYRYNTMTEITRYIDPVTQLTTKANLGTSRALGVELAADDAVTPWATLNVSGNGFFDTIDASNLGYSARRSTFSWIAKLGATLRPAKHTLVQLTTNYTSARLTPQGHKGATYIANIGLRQDLWQKKAAVIFTVSDIFNSLRDRTTVDTPELRERITRRRSPRIVYVGFIYKFGRPAKKSKDDALKFDEGL